MITAERISRFILVIIPERKGEEGCGEKVCDAWAGSQNGAVRVLSGETLPK